MPLAAAAHARRRRRLPAAAAAFSAPAQSAIYFPLKKCAAEAYVRFAAVAPTNAPRPQVYCRWPLARGWHFACETPLIRHEGLIARRVRCYRAANGSPDFWRVAA